ncbi:aminodeoxychorismate lyase [Bacillus clarus]|uniref:Aminodeoxychorismate lyase n=1 Tax=Bacillus clarus TaxID=2338372 RepID=A0A090ZEF5_9BACI|nr:aminotransferase class IV [Bacillus clarus]KFN02611.1 aminotransferase class IV family protein [Bacillus clarus]RFT64909.1 aminodeoxychorismate lyase [Bacillus clarus]
MKNILSVEVNGRPAQIEEFQILSLFNYGHFTSTIAMNGKIRGIDFHLERLHKSSRLLFGNGIDKQRIREYIRHAMKNINEPVIVRVNVFSRETDLVNLGKTIEPDILVTIMKAQIPTLSSLRLQITEFERDIPQVKNVGSFGQIYRGRIARMNGFDDVLFLDSLGRISEGSIWNIGFFDGDRIIWPKAEILPGIAMQLIQAGLDKNNIKTVTCEIYPKDLLDFKSAFITNSSIGSQAVSSIDDYEFSINPRLNSILSDAYQINPLEHV